MDFIDSINDYFDDGPRKPAVYRPEKTQPPIRYQAEVLPVMTPATYKEHPWKSLAGAFKGNRAWEAVKEEMRKARAELLEQEPE